MANQGGMTLAVWPWLPAMVVAYLIGSFPSGVLLGKLLGGPDVRYHGSGNVGGTNTMRLMGPGAGALVVFVDGLKGLLAWGVTYIIMGGSPWALPLGGAMAVLGHCWPLYTRFWGGMGLATAGGLLLINSFLTIVLFGMIWLAVFVGFFGKSHSPRAVIVAFSGSVVLSVLLIPLTVYMQTLLVALAVIVVVRHSPEWNRVQ